MKDRDRRPPDWARDDFGFSDQGLRLWLVIVGLLAIAIGWFLMVVGLLEVIRWF